MWYILLKQLTALAREASIVLKIETHEIEILVVLGLDREQVWLEHRLIGYLQPALRPVTDRHPGVVNTGDIWLVAHHVMEAFAIVFNLGHHLQKT